VEGCLRSASQARGQSYDHTHRVFNARASMRGSTASFWREETVERKALRNISGGASLIGSSVCGRGCEGPYASSV
jgi:hypothetical protein